MSFVFNPFTGNFDKVGNGQSVQSDINGLYKLDRNSPCFFKTLSSIRVKAGTSFVLNGVLYSFPVDTTITGPTLDTKGVDYQIYICSDGVLRYSDNFTAPTGWDTTNSRPVGGFHRGAIEPLTSVAGGNFATTGNGMIWTQGDVDKLALINENSIWDLKWRPKCRDPRGMALVANSFWADIYYLNTDHEVNGTSKYNSNVASGTVLPKKPSMFGSGNYASLNWWEGNEIAGAHGKRYMFYREWTLSTFGTTENQSLGGAASTIPLTQREPGYTSKWGLEQATGHHYTWGADSSYRTGGGVEEWKDENGGRGQLYLMNDTGLVYAIFGGHRGSGANSGSRTSLWNNFPGLSSWAIGARLASDHLILD